MFDWVRKWTRRYPSAGIFHFQRHPKSNNRTPSRPNNDGLAIMIDDIPTAPEKKRSGRSWDWTTTKTGWLSAPVLLFNTLLFVLLGSALFVVWHFNNRTSGFPLVTNNHYSWTYGPTAILVVVVAIWRQIDYHCKAALPWMNLANGNASAGDSVLLDHISPLQVISLWRALRNRHLSVVLTITGFVILKLVTLASTGLLLEESTDLPARIVSVNALNRFNGSLYNVTEYVTKSDASIVYTAYGIMAKGLAAGLGMTDSLAYTQFDWPSDLGFEPGNIQGQVDAFVPDFDCQPAEVSINPTPYTSNDTRTIIVTSPSCELMGGSEPVFVLDASSEICPPRQFRGVITRVNCSMDAMVSPLPDRRLLTMVEAVYNQTLNTTGSLEDSTEVRENDILSWSVGIKRTTSLLCRPSYSLGSLNLTLTTQGAQRFRTGAVEVLNASLPNFNDNDLALMFAAALLDGANMFGDLSDSDSVEEYPDTMMKLMASVSGGSYEDLLDPVVMTKAAQSAFNHIAVQLVSKNLLETAGSPLNAKMTTVEDRLRISIVPFWVMLSGFVAMCFLSMGTLRLRPKSDIASRTGNIYQSALVLAKSLGVHDIFHDLNSVEEDTVASKLNQFIFSSASFVKPDGRVDVMIQPFPTGDATSYSVQPSKDNRPWWKPLTCRPPFVLGVLVLPLLVIVALDLIQRYSESHDGILTLPGSNGTAATLYTRFIPSLAMLIIATSFNAVDFNISLLAPFNSMENRVVPAELSIKSSLIDKLALVALFQALKNRHYAAFCSSIAAIVGSVLTIVVSGLYTIHSVTGFEQSRVRTQDTFNTTWANSATEDGSAAVLTSLTESTNLAYPAFTYDELALPSTTTFGLNSSVDSQLQLTYPALRASLSCSILDSSLFNVSASYNPRLESSSGNVDARVPLPNTCEFGGPGGNLSFVEVNYRFGFQANQSFVGKLLDLHVGPYDPIQGSAFGESDPGAQKDNPAGCPSLAFIYGFIDVDNPSAISITTLTCYQQMQQIQTTVNFDLPSMSISTTLPPSPDESTTRLLQSSIEGDTTFSYRIQQHMDQSLSLFNQTKYASANLQQAPVDNFFQGVLFGRKPLTEDKLVGAANQNTMMQGINSFYRRYMAQAISNNMRISLPTGSSHSAEYDATIINLGQTPRLFQDSQAKLTLQILLGTMSLLGAIAWKLTKLGGLVPYNPCTIFGAMALLTGSRLVRGLSTETSYWNVPGEDASSRRQEQRYRLGWWDDSTEDSCEISERGLQGQDAPRKRRRYGVDLAEFEE